MSTRHRDARSRCKLLRQRARFLPRVECFFFRSRIMSKSIFLYKKKYTLYIFEEKNVRFVNFKIDRFACALFNFCITISLYRLNIVKYRRLRWSLDNGDKKRGECSINLVSSRQLRERCVDEFSISLIARLSKMTIDRGNEEDPLRLDTRAGFIPDARTAGDLCATSNRTLHSESAPIALVIKAWAQRDSVPLRARGYDLRNYISILQSERNIYIPTDDAARASTITKRSTFLNNFFRSIDTRIKILAHLVQAKNLMTNLIQNNKTNLSDLPHDTRRSRKDVFIYLQIRRVPLYFFDIP